MTTHKIDLTIYGDDPDTMYVVIPDLLRIIKAHKLECIVGQMIRQQVT